MPVTNRLRRRAFYGLAESRRLQALVQRNHALGRRAYRGAGRYLGGQALEEALASLARLHAEGFDTGVDYFGEARTDPAAVDATTRQYVRLNRELAQLDAGVNVWVDLTNVGLDISPELCRRQLAEIVGSLPGNSRLQVRAPRPAVAEFGLGAVEIPVNRGAGHVEQLGQLVLPPPLTTRKRPARRHPVVPHNRHYEVRRRA